MLAETESQTTSEHLQSIYSRLAPVYDLWTSLTESSSLDVALEKAAIVDGESILEVAVGTGSLFCDVLKRNPSGRTVGIDLAKPMLERARNKARKIRDSFELSIADATALPFSDQSFDLVINNNMLGLLPEPMCRAVLAEVKRVLRPGGRLVIVTMRRPTNLLARPIFQLGAVWLGGWRDIELRPFITSAGFEKIESQTVTQLGIPSDVILSLRPLLRPISSYNEC